MLRMRKIKMRKPTFEEAVAFLKAKYLSHNKAALAVGLSKSGYKYLVADPARPRSRHTRQWLIDRAVEHGWKGGDAA